MGLRSALRTFRRETPTLRRFAKWTAIAVAAFVVLFAAARITGNAVYGRRLEREMERFQALGGTTNLAELAPAPYAGPGINPARYLEAAGLIAPGLGGKDLARAGRGRVRSRARACRTRTRSQFAVWMQSKSNAGQLFGEVTADYAKRNPGKPIEWDDRWLPWLERCLAENELALRLARRGAAGEAGVFTTDWTRRASRRPCRTSRGSGLRETAGLVGSRAGASRATSTARWRTCGWDFACGARLKDEPAIVSRHGGA